MATNYGNKSIVTDGLIWKVDAANPQSYIGSGTTCNSTIGNLDTIAFTGSLTNGVSHNSTGIKYFEFDGNDDYIQFAANSTVTQTNPLSLYGSTTATFEVWVAPDMTGDSYQRILCKTSAGGGGIGGWGMTIHGTGYTMFYDNGSGTPKSIGFTDSSGNAEKWAHIVATMDGDTKKIYKDGVLKSTKTLTTSFPTTAAGVRIGSWVHSSGREYNGKLAVASVYNTALSLEEITQNYNALKSRFE